MGILHMRHVSVGSVSDKTMIQCREPLNCMDEGDAIMVDVLPSSFLICHQESVIRPTFHEQYEAQMRPQAVEQVRNIACARVHVEHVSKRSKF